MRPREAQHSEPEAVFFDAVVKCCTYVPYLHNFLVGRILFDADAAAQSGRATVQKRIAEAIGVTPLGLAPSPVYSLIYRSGVDAFGRSRALRCPHYISDSGRCGIWRNRNSICATWFCKHVRGHLGYRFWRDGLQRLLQAVEMDLARWCVLELEFGDESLRLLVANGDWGFEAGTVSGDSIDNRVDQRARASTWGKWHGREQEFYRRCGELVSQMDWTDVLAVCGAEALGYARLTQEAYHQLRSDAIPTKLRAGPFYVAHTSEAVLRVNTYSPYDPLDVPETVMQLLRYFDGRPTADALAAIADKRGVSLDAALVRKMTDFKLLVDPEGPIDTRQRT